MVRVGYSDSITAFGAETGDQAGFMQVTMSHASVKLDNYVRPFRGKGDDFDMFWAKFLALCRLQKLDTDAKKLELFPLFVEGDAFQGLCRCLLRISGHSMPLGKRCWRHFPCLTLRRISSFVVVRCGLTSQQTHMLLI